MAILNILSVPDPRLRLKSTPVEKVEGSLTRLMDDLLETMFKANGVGLAAPQVGISQRVIVADGSETETPEPVKMANPELIWVSEEEVLMPEACLSVPEQYGKVSRFTHVKVRYWDEHNKQIEREASGLLAQIVQHEIDHLNGVLFIDHLSSLKRNLMLRKAIHLGKTRKL